MERPVMGIDLGHGETAVFIRIDSRIFALRLDAAGSLKMITALAIIRGEDGRETVLLGNALRGYETLRKLGEADVQAVSGADFRALLLEYTTVLLDEESPAGQEHVLYIPCEESALDEDVRMALRQAVDACSPKDVHFTIKKGEYFSPLYQTFKAPPHTKENGFCAVTWDTVANKDSEYQRTMGDVMALFLRTLSRRLINYNLDAWQETQDGVDVHIGVPALREWLLPEAVEQYANMAALALSEWIRCTDTAEPAECKNGVYLHHKTIQTPLRRHVSIYSEPCAALMSYFREYPESRLQQGCAVSDHGSGSLDFCCVAVREGRLCRITGSTDQCGGRMIEDGMLRQLTDREGLSILRDLRPGEGSALRLHLRMLKEAYYADPDTVGGLNQRLRIHLKDGTVRTVNFTVREQVRNVVGPGARWHTSVGSFAENMRSAMTNQGLTSDSIFLTGGTANVTETQEIFAAAGMGQLRMSEDTSASVADGLCRMITRSELDGFRQDALAMLNMRDNADRKQLYSDLHTALSTELPAMVIEAAKKYQTKERGTSLRSLSWEVEKLLEKNKPLMGQIQIAVSVYAAARGKQLDPIVTDLAQTRFPGRLPECPQMDIDYSDITPHAARQIVRKFVQHLNLYGLLGSIVNALLALFGKGSKNPRLHKAELERIQRNMRKRGVSAAVYSAIPPALTDEYICETVDALVLEAMVGYLTLTRFDADLQL